MVSQSGLRPAQRHAEVAELDAHGSSAAEGLQPRRAGRGGRARGETRCSTSPRVSLAASSCSLLASILTAAVIPSAAAGDSRRVAEGSLRPRYGGKMAAIDIRRGWRADPSASLGMTAGENEWGAGVRRGGRARGGNEVFHLAPRPRWQRSPHTSATQSSPSPKPPPAPPPLAPHPAGVAATCSACVNLRFGESPLSPGGRA